MKWTLFLVAAATLGAAMPARPDLANPTTLEKAHTNAGKEYGESKEHSKSLCNGRKASGGYSCQEIVQQCEGTHESKNLRGKTNGKKTIRDVRACVNDKMSGNELEQPGNTGNDI